MPDSIRPFFTANGVKVLNLDSYLNYFFVVIANRLSRGASALYRERFGVGVVEWRCMVMLALENGVTAARISEVSGINKSLVSRALAKLEALKFVENYAGCNKIKPRRLQFTQAGVALYKEMIEVTLQRETQLRQGLSDNEISELLRMLKVMFANVEHLDQLEYHIDLELSESP